MLFGSHVFLFAFLPLVFTGFFLAGRRDRRFAVAWLALASLVFYGWWNPRFVVLLVASVAVNYLLGRLIVDSAGTRRGRALLVAAIALNLAALGFFKYANFFIATVNAVGGAGWSPLDIVLPLGISFFTFTQVAFLVDAYRGLARAYQFLDYLLFVSYFPHLIAGPILHHAEVIPQLESRATFRPRLDAIATGATLFAIGLAKKILVADPLGEFANAIFDGVRDGATPHFTAAWGGALAYTLQLYFDFSGYCDMAIGVSMLFNVKLPLNFDSPYKSASVIEFWRRWHMTLSRFLRDYLYVPLGGNRRGPRRRYVNVMLTMLLGGLWHGASWTFVAWGALHGIYLVVNHAWRGACARIGLVSRVPRASRLIATAITFLAVVAAWVVFRAADFGVALSMLSGMAGFNGVSLPASIAGHAAWAHHPGVAFGGVLQGFAPVAFEAKRLVLFLALGFAIVWLAPNSQEIARYDPRVDAPLVLPRPAFAAIAGALLAFSIMGMDRVSTFLYYQF